MEGDNVLGCGCLGLIILVITVVVGVRLALWWKAVYPCLVIIYGECF